MPMEVRCDKPASLSKVAPKVENIHHYEGRHAAEVVFGEIRGDLRSPTTLERNQKLMRRDRGEVEFPNRGFKDINRSK